MKTKENSFPVLPVLAEMFDRLQNKVGKHFNDIVFVCVQHLLESTGSLFESLLALGVRPENIYVLGKIYSTNDDVVNRLRNMGLQVYNSSIPTQLGGFAGTLQRDLTVLWDQVYQNISRQAVTSIIVLDDGGHCLASIPPSIWHNWSVIVIEQTTSGLYRKHIPPGRFPIIQVAACAAKKIIEPPMISDAIANRVRTLIPCDNHAKRFGVIGLGNIGQAVAKSLVRLGHHVSVFDKKPSLSSAVPEANWSSCIEEAIARADIIFGCAGENIFRNASWLVKLDGVKTLISCSSEDREFLSLLQFLDWQGYEAGSDPFKILSLELPNVTFKILRGGFPINFDNSPASVPAADIQVTRGLLFGAILQAILREEVTFSEKGRGEMLDPSIQRFVVTRWLELYPERREWYASDTQTGFTKHDWIRDQSSGYYRGYDALRMLFLP